MAEPIETVLVRAAALTADGRPHAAIELLRPALVSHPQHSGAWCRLAVAHLDAGEVSQSLDAAKRAITLGERSWAHRLASLALVELGRYDEAVVSAREAVRRDPSDWRCHVALAEALGPVSPDAAVEVARTAVELAPREARSHEVLGEAAVRVDDLGLARRAYRNAIRLDPGNEHIRAGLDGLTALRRRTPTDQAARSPAVRKQPGRPARFGRAQRVALWLLVRRAAVWLALGSFLLLIAGLPSPSPLLVWFGLALVLFVLGLVGHGWRVLPPGARAAPPVLRRTEPLILLSAVLLGVALLVLVVWTLALGFGSRGMQLLSVVFACSAVTAGLGSFGLWRLRVRTR
jgi:Flp pilus assembly protein TadD